MAQGQPEAASGGVGDRIAGNRCLSGFANIPDVEELVVGSRGYVEFGASGSTIQS